MRQYSRISLVIKHSSEYSIEDAPDVETSVVKFKTVEIGGVSCETQISSQHG